MSIHRYAARVDKTQASIVEALRMCGFHVELIRKPVDLAVRHPSWPKNRWMFAEAKTPRGKVKKTIAVDKRQVAQNEFVAREGVPCWVSPEQALRELYAASESLGGVSRPEAVAVRDIDADGHIPPDAVQPIRKRITRGRPVEHGDGAAK